MSPHPDHQPLAVLQEDGSYLSACRCGWTGDRHDLRADALILARALHDEQVAA